MIFISFTVVRTLKIACSPGLARLYYYKKLMKNHLINNLIINMLSI